MNITFKGSPNFDKNRTPIDRIVIHWFGEGTLDSANARFQNDNSNVSAHYGISNSTVWQWVKEENVAYHAGLYSMNQRSIGIEHDATTIKDTTEDTYKTSGALVREICQRHNIPMDREHIIKHNQIKATQCPGTLDIDKIIAIAKEVTQEVITDQTKIPQIVDSNGNAMEVQAIKSVLSDQKKTISELNAKILELSENQAPIFTKPIAIKHFELALEFEK